MNILHWVYGSANLLTFPQITVSAQFSILIWSTPHSSCHLFMSASWMRTPLHTLSYVPFSLWSILSQHSTFSKSPKIIIANIKKIFREFFPETLGKIHWSGGVAASPCPELCKGCKDNAFFPEKQNGPQFIRCFTQFVLMMNGICHYFCFLARKNPTDRGT